MQETPEEEGGPRVGEGGGGGREGGVQGEEGEGGREGGGGGAGGGGGRGGGDGGGGGGRRGGGEEGVCEVLVGGFQAGEVGQEGGDVRVVAVMEICVEGGESEGKG